MVNKKANIYSNQYISAGNTSASYPKQVFRNYGEIKYFCEISTWRIPLITDINGAFPQPFVWRNDISTAQGENDWLRYEVIIYHFRNTSTFLASFHMLIHFSIN